MRGAVDVDPGVVVVVDVWGDGEPWVGGVWGGTTVEAPEKEAVVGRSAALDIPNTQSKINK